MSSALNKELHAPHQEWCIAISKKCPFFLSQEYSNPCYVSVQDNWCEASQRIMIVGEEAHGTWGFGKSDGWHFDDFSQIQDFNTEYLQAQINHSGNYEFNRSAFWERVRSIASLEAPVAWNNLDKIFRLGNKCALTESERISLHNIGISILDEEIKLLKPTIVVFFGWYGISLKYGLPELFSRLYPNGFGDDSRWKNNVLSKLSAKRHTSVRITRTGASATKATKTE